MSDWQPAIMLPIEQMCEFHRKLFAQMPQETQEERKRHTGARLQVRPSTGVVLDPRFPALGRMAPRVDHSECVVIKLRDKDGMEAMGFSCEVSTD